MSATELPTVYQQFIHRSRYARYLPEQKRRETWEETVDRYVNFMVPSDVDFPIDREEIRSAILRCEVMPSMRALMTAGPALERENVCAYNCCFCLIDNPKRFAEILYILMCGTGVGFSCERQYIKNLPTVPVKLREADMTIVVEDSKIGWARAFLALLESLYAGFIPKTDFSQVRPAGSPLKTMGGRASGPGPLKNLFTFVINTFKESTGRRLTSLDVHKIVCNVGEVVVVGGVRRSALISLSNPSDDRMRHAKSGQWWEKSPYLSMANNSAAYTEKPEEGAFMREWLALFESKSGERGIFNREAARKQVARNGRRDVDHEWGTNPCSGQFFKGSFTVV